MAESRFLEAPLLVWQADGELKNILLYRHFCMFLILKRESVLRNKTKGKFSGKKIRIRKFRIG